MEALSNEELIDALIKRHGKERQQKFLNGKVAICGLGGLGSNIAISLARAGVGRLHLIDFDTVDISNLNRQQYFISQLGLKKTDALKDTILSFAPYCEIVTDTVKVTEDNLKALLIEDDIICEAFDDPKSKAMLAEGVLQNFKAKYLIAASGMAGFASANDIKTKKVANRFYLCGDGVSDIADGIGLISPRVMACAAHQAHMVLRILLGEIEP